MRRRQFLFPGVLLAWGCRRRRPQLRLYIDPDPYMTFRVMWHFTRESRIEVIQFDNHDRSGAASAARLTAEGDHPKADAYWSGDPIYCEILRQRGLAIVYRPSSQIPDQFRDPQDCWTGFAARIRVLLVRNALKDPPQSIRDYANPSWKGRGALANPLAGTTRSHFAALAAHWGDRELAAFYKAILKNGTRIAKTTEESADLVARGECDFALVDSDVALSRIQKQLPVDIAYPDQDQAQNGIMIVPNALMIVKGCKNVDAAQQLTDYMTSMDGELRVIQYAPYQVPLQRTVGTGSYKMRHIETLRVMRIDYAAAAQKLEQMEKILGLDPSS